MTRSISNKRSNSSHIIPPINIAFLKVETQNLASPVLPIPTYTRENTPANKQILASPVHPTPTYARENMLTISANLLVRRKILRLYFSLQHISSCRIQFVNGKQRDYCIHEQHYHIYGNNLKKHQKSRSKSTENTLKRHP